MDLRADPDGQQETACRAFYRRADGAPEPDWERWFLLLGAP
jgi:hypothetical protein